MKYTPVRKTIDSAGADLIAIHDYIIPDGKAVVVDTGHKLPPNHTGKDIFFALINRSSNGKPDKVLMLTNSFGVLDTDYPLNVYATFINLSGKTQHIKKGDSVVQVVVLEHLTKEFYGALNEKRTGGHGSTDRTDK